MSDCALCQPSLRPTCDACRLKYLSIFWGNIVLGAVIALFAVYVGVKEGMIIENLPGPEFKAAEEAVLMGMLIGSLLGLFFTTVLAAVGARSYIDRFSAYVPKETVKEEQFTVVIDEKLE